MCEAGSGVGQVDIVRFVGVEGWCVAVQCSSRYDKYRLN